MKQTAHARVRLNQFDHAAPMIHGIQAAEIASVLQARGRPGQRDKAGVDVIDEETDLVQTQPTEVRRAENDLADR